MFGDDGRSRGPLRPPATSNVNNWTTRARGNINFDARTQTDIGLIRAFIDFEMTRRPG